MENIRTYVLTVAFIAAVFFGAQPVGAYEVNTHAYLTKEAIELYNKNTRENKITSELQRFMIDGARHEDDLPRPQNHFYDPINNEGLDDGIYSGQSAKAWADDSSNQKKIGYVLLSDSSLTSVDWEKVKAFYPASDFTWNTAIKYWLKGDKEMAMEALGHVMHLVEDMGVPEHTRNDAHAGGSEYEEYAGRYDANNPDEQLKARLGDKKPFVLNSLDDYFDGLARYSNKYFYSPGSLGNYNFPELNYRDAESRERIYYIANKDDEGNKYYLATKKNIANIALGYSDVSVVDLPIKESYWSLLSVRTVRYSAGVIDQFFRDVEKARNDPNFLKEEKPEVSLFGKVATLTSSFFNGAKDIAVKAGSFFGNMLGAIGDGVVSAGSFIGGLFTGNNGLTNLGITDIGDPNGLDTGNDSGSSAPTVPTAAAVKKDALAKKDAEINALKLQVEGLQKDAKVQDEAVLKLEEKQDDPVAKKTSVDAPLCAYGSANRAGKKEVVINEVAWMGSVRSASDEWIELKNVSGGDVDISEWQLLNKGGGVKVRLGDLKNPIIKAGGFVLLERTDNNSAVGVTADLIYSGALANANDGLKLFNGSCAIVDEITVASKWAAGSNDTKQTMERRASGGWQTSVSAGGTPKKENSAGVAEADKKESVSFSGGSTQSGVGGDPLSVAPQFYPVVVNEIMYDVPGSDGGREWIELYNAGTSAVDISDWKLLENETNHALTIKQGSPTIPVGGYAVIADDVTDFLSDNNGFEGVIFDSTFSLSNDGEVIALKNGSLTIDSIAYATSTGANGNGMSLQKFNGGWSAASSTPGMANVAQATMSDEILKQVQDDNAGGQDDSAGGQDDNVGEDAGLSTSTILWDGGLHSGGVDDLVSNGFVGQRVRFLSGVDVGTLKFGYYNDYSAGSVEVKVFSIDGSEAWADTLAVPRISYGGYIEHTFSEPLYLDAGDYFVGSRLISGAIGIRRGIGLNPCGRATYISGNIPACVDGTDVGMIIERFVADVAVTASDEILKQVQDDNAAGMTQPSPEATAGEADAATTTPQFYPVVINEIMYDLSGADDNREWIEVYNAGTTTADIAGWKFFENNTNHGLAVMQGSSAIPVGGYAVIVASSTAFLNDNPAYGGTLFDSAFSLSNTGEALALKNGGFVIDSVTYASSTGANGYGMSLQKFGDGWHAASSTPGAVNVLQATTSDEILIRQSADQDDNAGEADIATTTPQLPVLAQLDDTAKSYTNPTSAFYQTFSPGSVQSIGSFRIAAEGISGRWKGGVCEFDPSKTRCASTGVSVRVDADTDMVSGVGKTVFTFLFASDILLDPSKTHAFFVEPTSNVSLRDRFASIYGSASNAYTGGGLYGYGQNWGINGPLDLGIADMYFEINAPTVPVVVPEEPAPAEQETATTTINIIVPPEEENTATTTPDIVMDPTLPIATSTEEMVSSE